MAVGATSGETVAASGTPIGRGTSAEKSAAARSETGA